MISWSAAFGSLVEEMRTCNVEQKERIRTQMLSKRWTEKRKYRERDSVLVIVKKDIRRVCAVLCCLSLERK